MKKLKSITAFALFSIAILSCSSDNDNNTPTPDTSCQNAATATATAAQAYAEATPANFAARCVAYKSALQAQISACGDASGELQLTIDDLGDCSVNTNTGVITVTAGSSVRTFETNITTTLVGTTLHVRADDDVNSDYIEFDIQQGAIGNDVLSNFNIHLISSDYNPLPDAEGGNWSSNITVNSATEINGTFYGYVTSPTTGADIDLNLGSIDINLQ